MAEDGEGSVLVDGLDDGDSISEEEGSTSENVNNQSEGSSENNNSTDADAEGSTTSEVVENKSEEEGKTETTEKGTRLDPDPLNRANQLRANAEAEARNYQALLNDPARLRSYIAELEAETNGGKAEETQDDPLKDLDPSKLETVEDLQNYAKSLKEATQKEIASVKQQLNGITSSQQQKETFGRIQSEISEIQSTYPELRQFNADGSKNPDYNSELDDLIGKTYEDLDYDKRTGSFRGRVSPKAIAEKIMGAKRIGEGSGSRKAQTQVVDKRSGRVITSRTNGSAQMTDETKLSPAATIADRMRRAASKK
jgi:hypothetical protein